MFSAMFADTGRRFHALEPDWVHETGKDILRILSKENALICPECKLDVRFRAGKIRRPHFAHKHKADCPFDGESAQLLHARAMLYERLLGSKLADDNPDVEVDIEVRLDDTGFNRPVDCVVKSGSKKFVYWLVDRQIRSSSERWHFRRTILDFQATQGFFVHIVFVNKRMLETAGSVESALRLSTTERDLYVRTRYDERFETYVQKSKGSLHYLDLDKQQLITYRGLQHTLHSAQEFSGHRIVSNFSTVEFDSNTGDMFHEGEHALIENFQLRQQKLEEQSIIDEYVRRFGSQGFSGSEINIQSARQITTSAISAEIDQTSRKWHPVGKCIGCGELTRNHWYFDGNTGDCRCRTCFPTR